MLWNRGRWRGALLGTACGLLAWLLTQHPLSARTEDWLQDWVFFFRGERHSPAPVLLIDIDDDFLDRLDKPLAQLSPEIADVIKYLKAQGTAVIGVDLIIPEN